jgi:PAS domain S-box-containing protein
MDTSVDVSIEDLRKQLEEKEAAYVSVLMEKNFLERALADFNFHHNAHDGIVFTDTENRVVYANPYFLEMMDITDPAELLNKPLPSAFWTQPDDAAQLFKDIREDGFVRERELHLLNKQGSPIFAMCSSVASRDKEGGFVGTEMMFCNITSKRRIQAELATRSQDLERVTEFCKLTLDTLLDAVSRSASVSELKGMLQKMQAELAKVTSE